MYCVNNFKDVSCYLSNDNSKTCPSPVSSQQECQQRCIEKTGCVGITYSHKDRTDKRFCLVCSDDELFPEVNTMTTNGIGFYRKAVPTTEHPIRTTTPPMTSPSTSKTNKPHQEPTRVTNPEKKQTTIGNFLRTEVKSNLTISQKFESTKSANKKMTKAATDKKDHEDPWIFGNPGANNFLSIIAFSVMFVPFILNA